MVVRLECHIQLTMNLPLIEHVAAGNIKDGLLRVAGRGQHEQQMLPLLPRRLL
jgi:hypothetical protein